jgi:hypothetical protein
MMLKNISPMYNHFIASSDRAAHGADVEIRLEVDNLPDTACLRKIFDTEESWTMFCEEDTFFLELKPPPLREPLWIARFDRRCRDITIFCGEPSLTREVNRIEALNPLSYPLDQVLLMHLLSQKQGAVVHAAGMTLHGSGYIFPGRSGAGKSTIARLLSGRHETGMLSDDRIIIRRHGDTFRAYGTPWPGDAGIAENVSAQLDGIIFIHHDSCNRMKELAPREAWKMLIPVTSIPWYDEKTLSDILRLCEDLVYNIPVYELYFRPDSTATDYLEEFLVSGTAQ